MLCSVIEDGMTPFRCQTVQKNSASLCSSVRQFDNSMTSRAGRRALFSYRAQYDVIEFSNYNTEERNEAEFFCAVWK